MSSSWSMEHVEGALGAQGAGEIVEDLADDPYLCCVQQGIGILAQEAGFDTFSTTVLDFLTQLWAGMTRQIAVEMHSSAEASGRSLGSKVDFSYALVETGLTIKGLRDYVERLKANPDSRRLVLPLPDPGDPGFEPKRQSIITSGYTPKTMLSIFDHLPPIPDITKNNVTTSKSKIPGAFTRKQLIDAKTIATRNLHEFYLRTDGSPLEMKAAIILSPSFNRRVIPEEWANWAHARGDWLEGKGIREGVFDGEKEYRGEVTPGEEKDDGSEEGRQGRESDAKTKVKSQWEGLLNPPMPPAMMMDVPIIHPTPERQPYLAALLADNTSSQMPRSVYVFSSRYEQKGSIGSISQRMGSTTGFSSQPRSCSVGPPTDSTLYSSMYTIQQLASLERRKHGIHDVSSSSESDAEHVPGTDRIPIVAPKKAGCKSFSGTRAFSFDGGPDKAFSGKAPAGQRGRMFGGKVASTKLPPKMPQNAPGTIIVEDDDILQALTSANEELEREAVASNSEEELLDTHSAARKKSLRKMVSQVDEHDSSSTDSDEEIMDTNVCEYIKPLPRLGVSAGEGAVGSPDTEIQDNPFALPPTR